MQLNNIIKQVDQTDFYTFSTQALKNILILSRTWNVFQNAPHIRAQNKS